MPVYYLNLLTLFTERSNFDQLLSDNRDFDVFVNFEGSHLPPFESFVQLGPKTNVSFLLNNFSVTACNQATMLLLRNGQARLLIKEMPIFYSCCFGAFDSKSSS